MLSKISNTIDACIMSVGGLYGLSQIESILGIMILSIQVVWLISKLIIKIVRVIKRKKSLEDGDLAVDEFTGDVKDLMKDIFKSGDM